MSIVTLVYQRVDITVVGWLYKTNLNITEGPKGPHLIAVAPGACAPGGHQGLALWLADDHGRPGMAVYIFLGLAITTHTYNICIYT